MMRLTCKLEKKVGALIRSMKFLSFEVTLYLYKSTLRPCMEYCFHVLAGTPSCYLELLDKLQQRIYRTVDPSLAASLEPLAHRQNVASLSLFYRYYFGRCSSELAQLVPLPFSRGRSTHYSDRLHDFSVAILRCYKNIYVNSFFPRRARLWNSQRIECFLLTYDQNGFKARIRFFLNRLALNGQILFLCRKFNFCGVFVAFFASKSLTIAKEISDKNGFILLLQVRTDDEFNC